jgi:type 1 glutamine amidotransferase
MLRRTVCSIGIMLLTVALAATAHAADPAAPLKIHIIAFGEYDPVITLTAFKEHLEKTYKVECSMSLCEKNKLTNLEPLKNADLLILFARRMDLPQTQMEVIRAHWDAGKPVVGIRTAQHAFQAKDNAIIDRQVFGGHYSGGGPTSNGAFKAVPADGAENHPVLKGVEPFKGTKYAYGQGTLAETTTLLQVAKTPKAVVPVTWANTYKGGRMLYTSLGAADDFKDEQFRKFLTNAIFWTSQRDPERMKK